VPEEDMALTYRSGERFWIEWKECRTLKEGHVELPWNCRRYQPDTPQRTKGAGGLPNASGHLEVINLGNPIRALESKLSRARQIQGQIQYSHFAAIRKLSRAKDNSEFFGTGKIEG